MIVDQIPNGASVLDLGCGTGLLSMELARVKGCRVLGIDLSSRMIEFARIHNTYDSVEFLHGDATNLGEFKVGQFDFIVILNFIHELWPDQQDRLLGDALRAGQEVILFDSVVPLPLNLPGIIKRVIEVSFGTDHFSQFKAYLASGGIQGILDRNSFSGKILTWSFHASRTNLLVRIVI